MISSATNLKKNEGEGGGVKYEALFHGKSVCRCRRMSSRVDVKALGFGLEFGSMR